MEDVKAVEVVELDIALEKSYISLSEPTALADVTTSPEELVFVEDEGSVNVVEIL